MALKWNQLQDKLEKGCVQNSSGKPRQKNCKFKPSVDNFAKSCLKTMKMAGDAAQCEGPGFNPNFRQKFQH